MWAHLTEKMPCGVQNARFTDYKLLLLKKWSRLPLDQNSIKNTILPFWRILSGSGSIHLKKKEMLGVTKKINWKQQQHLLLPVNFLMGPYK